MSVNNQQDNLKTDIKNFIHLLQNNQGVRFKQRRISLDSDKLSVIYSASQPESSTGDKQSRHHSGPLKSMEQYPIDVQFLINKIKQEGLLPTQLQALQKIQLYIQQLRRSKRLFENRHIQIQKQFQCQRKFTDQILKALTTIDRSQQQINHKYQDLHKKYSKLQQQYLNIQNINKSLESRFAQNQKDLSFMKKLVLVANQNYQKIQKKCIVLQKNLRKLQNFKNNQQRSSPNITSRSTITYDKNSIYSPSASQKLILSARRISKDGNLNQKKSVTKTSVNKNIR